MRYLCKTQYCREIYGTRPYLTDRSRVYMEDRKVSAQPMEVTLKDSEAGGLLRASTARLK